MLYYLQVRSGNVAEVKEYGFLPMKYSQPFFSREHSVDQLS